MTVRGFVTGLAGLALTPAERAFLRDAEPWGVILFERNIATPDQLRRLVAGVREAVGRADAAVLIDQEGGRVQRLKPPQWPAYPAAGDFGELYERDQGRGRAAARLGARLIAADLDALGISIACLPVADVPVPGSDPVIGDRAYGTSPDKVADLASAVADGLADGGILPVVKHIPGHGRARVDSHAKLPEVTVDRAILEATDFAAFRALAHLPLAMTAHIVFTKLDPLAPATISATIVAEVIRGFIGFAGLLMTDDLSMGALGGPLRERARAAFAAGCDIVLHCNGRMEEMRVVAAEASKLDTGAVCARLLAAQGWRRAPQPLDLTDARAAFCELMSASPRRALVSE